MDTQHATESHRARPSAQLEEDIIPTGKPARRPVQCLLSDADTDRSGPLLTLLLLRDWHSQHHSSIFLSLLSYGETYRERSPIKRLGLARSDQESRWGPFEFSQAHRARIEPKPAHTEECEKAMESTEKLRLI